MGANRLQRLLFGSADRVLSVRLASWNETEAQGYRVEKPSGEFIKTPDPKSADAIIETKGALQLDGEGNLRGQVHVVFTGQDALQRRLAGSDKDDAGRRKALVDEVKSWLPPSSTAEFTDLNKWDQSAEPVRAEFAINIPGYASSTGRRLLAPLGIFHLNRQHAFQNAKRIHPVYFPYPYQQVDEIEVQLPAGLKVESLPKPLSQQAPFGRYEISFKGEGGRLLIRRQMTMDGIIFRTESYPELRIFYNGIRSGDEQQAVLQNNVAADSSDRK